MNAELKSEAAGPNTARERRDAQTTPARGSDADSLQATKIRHYLFGAFILVCIAAFWPTLKALVDAALHFDFCSQIVAVPFIAIALVYWRRHSIFRTVKGGYAIGSFIFVAGLIVHWFARRDAALLGSYDSLSASALGMVIIWAAGFYVVYGAAAFRSAAFPLGFLILTVPIPNYFLDRSVFYLQAGSTAVSDWLFRILGVPVTRHGLLLALPGLTIEVARECSSIRSSIALVITCLLAGYLFLRSPWKRAVLVLTALPLSVFKNGVRIVTLSLLSIYVNPAFMWGDLHRDGGILFYLLALAILYPLFCWFEELDHRTEIGSELDRGSENIKGGAR
jgi:exosortase